MSATSDQPGPAHYITRLAGALASEHLPLHGPFIIHLCRRVVEALYNDQATLTRLIEAAEAARARPGLVAELTRERFGGHSR